MPPKNKNDDDIQSQLQGQLEQQQRLIDDMRGELDRLRAERKHSSQENDLLRRQIV